MKTNFARSFVAKSDRDQAMYSNIKKLASGRVVRFSIGNDASSHNGLEHQKAAGKKAMRTAERRDARLVIKEYELEERE